MSETKGTTADKVRWRDEDRAVAHDIAGGDIAKAGKATLHVQQSHMSARADDAEYDYKAARKARQARKTGGK